MTVLTLLESLKKIPDLHHHQGWANRHMLLQRPEVGEVADALWSAEISVRAVDDWVVKLVKGRLVPRRKFEDERVLAALAVAFEPMAETGNNFACAYITKLAELDIVELRQACNVARTCIIALERSSTGG